MGSPHPGPHLWDSFAQGGAPRACAELTPAPVYPADSWAHTPGWLLTLKIEGNRAAKGTGGTAGPRIPQEENHPVTSPWSCSPWSYDAAHALAKSPPGLRLGWGHGDSLMTPVGESATPGWGRCYCERPSLLASPCSDGRTAVGAQQAPHGADCSAGGSRLAWDPVPAGKVSAPASLLGFPVASMETEHKAAEQSVCGQTDRQTGAERGNGDGGGAAPANTPRSAAPRGTARETEARGGSGGPGEEGDAGSAGIPLGKQISN